MRKFSTPHYGGLVDCSRYQFTPVSSLVLVVLHYYDSHLHCGILLSDQRRELHQHDWSSPVVSTSCQQHEAIISVVYNTVRVLVISLAIVNDDWRLRRRISERHPSWHTSSVSLELVGTAVWMVGERTWWSNKLGVTLPFSICIIRPASLTTAIGLQPSVSQTTSPSPKTH